MLPLYLESCCDWTRTSHIPISQRWHWHRGTASEDARRGWQKTSQGLRREVEALVHYSASYWRRLAHEHSLCAPLRSCTLVQATAERLRQVALVCPARSDAAQYPSKTDPDTWAQMAQESKDGSGHTQSNFPAGRHRMDADCCGDNGWMA